LSNPCPQYCPLDTVEDAQHSQAILPPEMDVAPSSFVRPDMSPPDDALTDLALPADNPLDVDIPVTTVPDGDCSDTSVTGSLPQVVYIQPKRRVLRDLGSIKPPRRLVCEMNDHAVDEASEQCLNFKGVMGTFESVFS
ncbi:hypothetical protein XENOCAPTIV_005812, partial [Xenoophorus captivus]